MVLVCHDHRFIFLKTRKTAGTSIEMLLEPLCAPPGHVVTEKTMGFQSRHGIVGFRLLEDGAEKPSIWRAHMPAHLVAAQLPRDQWGDYFRFSCLRNPFDKIVSQFFWDLDYHGNPKPGSLDDTRAAFRHYVLERDFHTDKSVTHRKGNFVLNGFLRYEALTEDLERLRTKLNLPIDPKAMVSAKSATSRLKDVPVSAYYDAETTGVILDKLAWIFEQGKYSCNPQDADARTAPPQQKWKGLKRRQIPAGVS